MNLDYNIKCVWNIGSRMDCTCSCRKQAGCTFFSWVGDRSVCCLKNSDAGRVEAQGMFSGYTESHNHSHNWYNICIDLFHVSGHLDQLINNFGGMGILPHPPLRGKFH